MKEQGHGHIPDDCWELIFEKVRQDDERDLDSISLVSKRFLSISNRVKLSLKVNDETISFLPDFFRRFRYIETIIIGTDACKNIDGLVDQITPSDLLNLQAIKFGGFPTRHRRAQYVFKSLVALSKNRKDNLKVLDCSGLICMQESDLVLIPDLFPRLEELKITAAINNGDVAARGVDALASKLKDLKEFAFTGNTYLITDQSLISLSTNCVKLKRISLVGISSTDQHYVTGEGIDFVMRHSPNLTDLSLHLWSLQSSASSFKIANGYTNAKNLHSLSMNKQLISNKHIRLVAKARPALKTLKLIGYRGRYFEIHGALKLLLHACELTLEELNLGCWPLTDANISNLAEHLSNLTFIDLQGCFELTSVTFYTLTRSCPSLEILKMTNERGQQMDTCRFKKKRDGHFFSRFFSEKLQYATP